MLIPTVPISWGELVDKVTILELKLQNILDSEAKKNVAFELQLLLKIVEPLLSKDQNIRDLKYKLSQINQELWLIEDRIREKEATNCFDSEFISLARSVYITNDKRAATKRELNVYLNSSIVEEKSYKEYGT